MIRAIGVVVVIQLAFDEFDLWIGMHAFREGAAGVFFVEGGLIAILCGIAGWWRPAFVLVAAAHYVLFRCQIAAVSGIAVSATDYQSMLDILEFAVVGGLVAASLTRTPVMDVVGKRFPELPLGDPAELRRVAGSLLWACAVGAHLGNYFYSGIEKILAGWPHPLTWVLGNQTGVSILLGLERGDSPLAPFPSLVQLTWNAIAAGGVALNVLVIVPQLLAPFAALNRRALLVFVVLFDVFHIAVYLTLGTLFLFWIVVNTVIFFTLWRMRDSEYTNGMKLVAFLAVGLGHYAFYTSHLGWLDAAKLTSPSFTAETRDGRRVAVPPVFFGIFSYPIAQNAMYIPDDQFKYRLGGNAFGLADWDDARNCRVTFLDRQPSPVALDRVDAMVQQTDATMRAHPFVKRDNLYYIYPQHALANPFLFRDFNSLAMGDIVRYHYIVDSVCLSLQDGKLVRHVYRHWDHVIDVSGH